jgi:dephospho-CoA kinase
LIIFLRKFFDICTIIDIFIYKVKQKREYFMIIAGLTGTMASGKSTVLNMFKTMGAVTISADQLIHLLQQKDTEQTKALTHVLGKDILTKDGRIDRSKLSELIIKDKSILKMLEQIFYPSLKAMMKKLIKTAEQANQNIVFIEIPLLFEAGFENLVDTTIVCSATDEVAKQRSLARTGMNEQKFNALSSARLKDCDLVKLAKNIINTNIDEEKTQAQAVLMYADLLTMSENVWPHGWAQVEDI